MQGLCAGCRISWFSLWRKLDWTRGRGPSRVQSFGPSTERDRRTLPWSSRFQVSLQFIKTCVKTQSYLALRRMIFLLWRLYGSCMVSGLRYRIRAGLLVEIGKTDVWTCKRSIRWLMGLYKQKTLGVFLYFPFTLNSIRGRSKLSVVLLIHEC
jgi:hypothetical protein